MKAVVTDGHGGVEVATVAPPSLEAKAADESSGVDHGVVVDVLAAGLCGSDLHVVDDPQVPVGTIIGHELVGEVVDVGRGVTDVHVGERCVVPFNVSCGTCTNCSRGLTTHCLRAYPPRSGATYGMGMGWQGFQAERAVIPWADHTVFTLHDDASQTSRDLLVLVADVVPTALHAVARAGVRPGHQVYVAGAGPIGLAVALTARRIGADVWIGEPNQARAARVHQADIPVLDPTQSDSLSEHLADLGATHVDAAVDCVGAAASAAESATRAGQTFDALLDLVRVGGSIAIPGVYPDRLPAVPVQLGMIWRKALIVAAGATPARRYIQEATELLAAPDQPFEPLRPVPYELDDAVTAYADFRTGKLTKGVLSP